ncbi:hypothetical protein MTR_4g055633 [Medicago truncatula]|uniref:Uncharacterized protein n=1 Tax=Medicago truncatula TaxID=3880 RepID=A0A072UVM6_MEDTR|nr:hypothetical protein MTR_4g055633 [Medicago truncatula]
MALSQNFVKNFVILKSSWNHLLSQFLCGMSTGKIILLKHLLTEGIQDLHVCNTPGKIIIDINNNLEHFVTTNAYYDSRLLVNIVRNEALRSSLLLTKGSNVMLSMLQPKTENLQVCIQLFIRKVTLYFMILVESLMLFHYVCIRYAAESQPCLCRTILIDQVVSTAFPESKRMLQLNHRNYKRCHLFLFELWLLLNTKSIKDVNLMGQIIVIASTLPLMLLELQVRSGETPIARIGDVVEHILGVKVAAEDFNFL